MVYPLAASSAMFCEYIRTSVNCSFCEGRVESGRTTVEIINRIRPKKKNVRSTFEVALRSKPRKKKCAEFCRGTNAPLLDLSQKGCGRGFQISKTFFDTSNKNVFSPHLSTKRSSIKKEQEKHHIIPVLAAVFRPFRYTKHCCSSYFPPMVGNHPQTRFLCLEILPWVLLS